MNDTTDLINLVASVKPHFFTAAEWQEVKKIFTQIKKCTVDTFKKEDDIYWYHYSILQIYNKLANITDEKIMAEIYSYIDEFIKELIIFSSRDNVGEYETAGNLHKLDLLFSDKDYFTDTEI